MVKKVLSILNREISGLHEAAYLLGFFAIASQILALVRDRVFAHTFGASSVLDIYYASFRIPDLIFVSVASLVSISILVPFFMEKFKGGEEEGKKFVDATFSIFFLLISTVCVIIFFLLPYILPKVLPGFDNEASRTSLITLSRIMLLSPFFLGISNFLASITQIYNRFFIYAISPLLYNFGIIIGAVAFYPILGVSGLAWGVVFGAILHCLIQVPFVIERKLFPRITFNFQFREVKNLVFLSLPRMIALSANQIATFFLVSLASLMSIGSIAVFNFSWNLQSVPLSIIGASYASAAFPALSRFITSGKKDEFLDQMITSSRHIIFWSVPMATMFIVLRAQIVRTILGSGNFTWSDTRLTAACLAIFAFSVVAQSLLLLFVRGYYALGQTWKPLAINVISSVFLVISGYVFVKGFYQFPVFRYFIETIFKVDSVSGSVVLVLPLAYSIGTFINMVIHWITFEFEFKGFSKPIIKTLFASFSASVIMGYATYLLLNIFDDLFNINTVFGIFMQGFCSGILGIASGVLVLVAVNNEEVAEIWKAFHKRIWGTKITGVDSAENPIL